MAQYFSIHPQDPQPRLIKHAVEILQKELFGEIALGKGARFEESAELAAISPEEDYK